MSLTKLLELMRSYDFSAYGGNVFPPKSWGGLYSSIIGNARNLVELDLPADIREASKEGIYSAYVYMRVMYDKIDFERLEAEIEDEGDKYYVETLFRTRDLLSQLGTAILSFMRNISKETLEDIDDAVKQMAKADRPAYRDRIKELEQRLTTV